MYITWCFSVLKIAKQTLEKDDFWPFFLEILILFQNSQQNNGHLLLQKHSAIEESLV